MESVCAPVPPGISPFLRRESAVRGYCRSFPAVFHTARGATLIDEEGREWLDFLCGAGSLNYGHNPPPVIEAVQRHLADGGLLHGLDLHTTAKRRFLERFEELVLDPHNLDYRIMFPGPTGTNAVEAALKLTRRLTGRSVVHAFTNGFHGMSLGALSLTGSGYHRQAAGLPLAHGSFLPYDGYLGPGIDTVALAERLWDDPSSGWDLPAAVLVETVQGEGGVNPASLPWLRRLASACSTRGILLVVDDIQAGCGRTGPFFSFQAAGIVPDLVLLAKSIGGCGLPLALLLIRPDLDRWRPAEHNGTFRGNQLAFVAGAAALDAYWRDRTGFEQAIIRRSVRLCSALEGIAAAHPDAGLAVRGRGLMQGLVCPDPELAARISASAYDRGLIIERSGPRDEVVKAMPPLTIPMPDLDRGCAILAEAVANVCWGYGSAPCHRHPINRHY